jgi:hypothetical protein
MLGHAHQTGALHINAGATDAVLFFDAGTITHAECGSLFGDEAVIHIVKSCVHGGAGVYKFVYGATSAQHTVLRSATDLMLDAMREYDESTNSLAAGNPVDADSAGKTSTHENSVDQALADLHSTDQDLSDHNPADDNLIDLNLADKESL